MLTLEQIIEKLYDRNIKKVAKKTGLDPSTIYRIKNRDIGEKVTYETIRKLSDYLEGKSKTPPNRPPDKISVDSPVRQHEG